METRADHASPRTATASRDRLTFGVEEEFLVVDKAGQLSDAAVDVVDAAEHDQGDLQRELTRSQAETATGVCHSHEEALRQLRSLRAELAQQAADRDLRLLPSATTLLDERAGVRITSDRRYQHMADHFGAIARSTVTCGCHVHVAVPDRDSGVRVLNYLRPWLPALLTITANSAVAEGKDTGYHSWRYQQWGRWPSAGPPPHFYSTDQYDTTIDACRRAGALLDQGMVYWDARLSDRLPTIELRVADVAANPEEAVLLATLTRGLVATALDSGEPAERLSNEVLRAHLWRASRDGASGRCLHPGTMELAPVNEVVGDLVATSTAALDAAGDLEFVRQGIARLASEGSGADRQRACFRRRERPEDVVDLLAITVASSETER